jgi:hypothetical protein
MASDGELAVNNVLETIWMEAIVTWFKVRSRKSRGKTEENQRILGMFGVLTEIPAGYARNISQTR